MNSVSIKGSTPLTDLSESEAANNKYRKAIKQINKLISINTSVKKQLINVQEQYDNLRKKYNQLEDKFMQLSEELDQRNSYQVLPIVEIGKHVQSVEQQMSSQGQIQILKNKDQENRYSNNFLGLSTKDKDKDKDRRDYYSPLSGKAKQLQNTGTLSEYIDTKKRLEQMQQKLADKDKQIQSLTQQLDLSKKQNASLYQKYVEISNNLSKAENQALIKDPNDVNKLISDKKSLETELTKYKQSTQKLSKQLQTLKNKNSILVTSQQSIISNAKSRSAFNDANKFTAFGLPARPPAVPYHPSFYSSANQSLQSSIQQTSGSDRRDPFSQYYFKKVRDLQAEIMKMKKQFSEKKIKYKNQITKLKQEIQVKDTKISQINAFIVKQQSFIQSFYNKQQQSQPSRQHKPHQPLLLSNKKSSASSQSPTHTAPLPPSSSVNSTKYYHQYESSYNQHRLQSQQVQSQQAQQIPSTVAYYNQQQNQYTGSQVQPRIGGVGLEYKGYEAGKIVLGGQHMGSANNINFNTQQKYQYDDIKRY